MPWRSLPLADPSIPLADPSIVRTGHVPTQEPGSSSLSVVIGGVRIATPQVSDRTLSSGRQSRTTCEATHQRQTRASDAECPHGRIAPEGTKVPSRAARIACEAGRFEEACVKGHGFLPVAAMKPAHWWPPFAHWWPRNCPPGFGAVQSQVGGDGSGSRLGRRAGQIAGRLAQVKCCSGSPCWTGRSAVSRTSPLTS